MLIRFSAQNFRSIGMQPLTLDFVTSSKIRTHPSHICSSNLKAKILRNAVIYGGNSCGKSNIIKAISFFKAIMTQGRLPQGTTREYCRAGEGHAQTETAFEIQFEVNGEVYDYTIGCLLAEYRITSECLYRLHPHKQLIFSREDDTAGSTITWGPDLRSLSPEEEARKSIYTQDYLNDIDARLHVPLCCALSQGKVYPNGSPLTTLGMVPAWCGMHLQIITAGQPSPTSEFYLDSKTLDDVAAVLASFDTGISAINKHEISLDELEKQVDPTTSLMIRNMLAQNPPLNDDANFVITLRGDGAFIGIERKGLDDPVVTILETEHAGSTSVFQFGDESDGTRRLFDFMDLLFSKDPERVFVIDEFDRSLHPMLTKHFVELFNTVHADDRCQMLFTTHESSIMSLEYYRKDEIWFVDRDDSGCSKLYPLSSFSDLRNDVRLEKNYLDGRFGGVPVLSSYRSELAVTGED